MSNGNVFFANGFHHIRKLTELNATGNDLSGVPPGLLSLVSSKLDRLQLEHNPLLSAIPGEFEHGYRSADSPQLLKHLALLKLYTECRLRLTGKTGLAESGTCKSSDKSSDGWRYWTDVYLLTQRWVDSWVPTNISCISIAEISNCFGKKLSSGRNKQFFFESLDCIVQLLHSSNDQSLRLRRRDSVQYLSNIRGQILEPRLREDAT